MKATAFASIIIAKYKNIHLVERDGTNRTKVTEVAKRRLLFSDGIASISKPTS